MGSIISDEADLIVVGGGLAGHSAALQAAEQGASVLLLEKTRRPGGSTVQSSGSFAFAGTQAQRDAGYDDSPQKMAGDIVKASGGLADAALVDVFLRHQTDAYEWLRAHGVRFHPVSLSSNQAVPRTHATDPQQLMDALHAAVAAMPRIRYLDGAAVDRLQQDDEGRVTGVTFMHEGRAHRASARFGVVLASGGFSRSAELIAKFSPRMSAALRLGGEGNTGDGLLMAWKLGADFVDTAHVTGTFGISLNHYPENRPPSAEEAVLRLAIYRGGIAVNRRAERFADESVSYKTLGEICLSQPDGIGFQIWDQNIMELSAPAPSSTDFDGALARGLVRVADDYRSLARAVGLDPDTLAATIERYNRDVDSGVDSVFGRASLGKGWGKLVKIERPPFYIYPCTTAVLATYCGLRVDRDMRVVDVFGKALDGLYAAGEIVGGFHGSGYMSGSSLSKSVIFGRVAADAALAGQMAAA